VVKFSASIKHSSVLRKFTVLFLLSSIIPLSLLAYIYFQLKPHSELSSYIPNLKLALTLTIIGIIVGYFAMRKIVNEFISVGDSTRSSLSKILGQQGLTYPGNDSDEIAALMQTFNEVKQRLEKDIQDLKLTKSTLHSVLSKVSQAVATEQNIDSFLQLIVETSTDAFLGKSGFILLIDKKNNDLYVKAMTGMDPTRVQKKRFKLSDSIWAMVINSKAPVIISKDTDFLQAPLLCAPLVTRDEPQGILIISGRRILEDYAQEDQTLIYTVASQTAAILNNVELKTLADIDPLTNIFNYRHFVGRLDYEIARLKRYSGALCLLIIDIDDFKSYNDAFGHVEGDKLLQSVASTMHNLLRVTDIACRYAGDEFVVILTGTDIAGAKVAAEKIRNAVEHIALKQKVTVSIGCAKWTPNLTRQELIVKADTALYKAKNNNKNNVAISDGD